MKAYEKELIARSYVSYGEGLRFLLQYCVYDCNAENESSSESSKNKAETKLTDAATKVTLGEDFKNSLKYRYGIEIVKIYDSQDCENNPDESAYCAISDDRIKAVEIANLFASNFVTPVSASDIVEDLMSQN